MEKFSDFLKNHKNYSWTKNRIISYLFVCYVHIKFLYTTVSTIKSAPYTAIGESNLLYFKRPKLSPRHLQVVKWIKLPQ